jgi:hypothetical protein
MLTFDVVSRDLICWRRGERVREDEIENENESESENSERAGARTHTNTHARTRLTRPPLHRRRAGVGGRARRLVCDRPGKSPLEQSPPLPRPWSHLILAHACVCSEARPLCAAFGRGADAREHVRAHGLRGVAGGAGSRALSPWPRFCQHHVVSRDFCPWMHCLSLSTTCQSLPRVLCRRARSRRCRSRATSCAAGGG